MELQDPDLLECVDCGALVSVRTGRSFLWLDAIVLCFDCAVRRGGRYDEANDAWVESPTLEGFGLA